MKYRRILISLLFAALSFSCFGQIGIIGGAGVCDIVFADEGQIPYLGYDVNYITHRKPLANYQMGVFGTIPINRSFQFQPELLYARQGLNYNIEFLYDNITYRMYIHYIKLPLLIKLKTRPNKKFHPGLFLGPYASLKIKANLKKMIGGNTTEQQATNVKTGDFGIVGGISFDHDLKKGQLISDIRFDYSLMNMMKNIDEYIPNYNGPDKERARNVSLVIMLGYQFNISK